MKITEMLKREDFYAINAETLKDFYKEDFSDECTKLFVYPKLNAIVTAKPGKSVKKFLLTEYALRSGIKRLAAQCYTRLCFLSRGGLAEKKLEIEAAIDNDTLIYPCNKKYRIFDFDSDIVHVMIKHGFDKSNLMHEIEFRSRKDLPDFVPCLIEVRQDGYSEKIIDGCPLARIADMSLYETYKKEAYDLLWKFAEDKKKTISASEYIEILKTRIDTLSKPKNIDSQTLDRLIDKLSAMALPLHSLSVCFTHGDLQTGNIWVENNTGKVFIIDWESWGERSVWYDQAVLFDRLRPGDIEQYLNNNSEKRRKAIILLEDIVFQLEEINSLPADFGVLSFYDYLDKIERWIQTVR